MKISSYIILVFGFTFILDPCLSSRSIHGRFSQNIKDFEIIYPVKVSASGRVISHNLKHFFPSVSRSRHQRDAHNNTVRYKIAIDRDEKHVTLQPNYDLVAPGSIVEVRRARSSDGLPGIELKPLSENHCHFHGSVDGEVGSRAALSTCNGLAGYVIIGQQLYLIEPVNPENEVHRGSLQPHVIYKSDNLDDVLSPSTPNGDPFCGTKAASSFKPRLHSSRALEGSHLKTNVHVKESKEYFLETMVVADKTMIAFHKNMDLEQYILTVFNMAYNMYHDASLGAQINLVLVRIIRLEDDETDMNNAVVSSAQETLKSFCAWADKQNPEEESHPNHHDVALLLTRVDLCDEGVQCGLLGLAYTGGACSRVAQCSVNEDNGLTLGFVITHEIGHNLGMNHDTVEETGCPAELPDGSITVMSPYVSMDITEWSPCSRKALITFLDSEKGSCMEDKPKAHKFNIADILPGVVYGGDYQCQQMFDPSSKQCSTGVNCEKLVCEVPKYGCFTTEIVPAPGTPCGENKWCYRRKCLTVGERPESVDGDWGSWSEWSACSRDCGIALSSSTRACNNPPPSHGGRYCLGERKRYRMCDHKACPKGYPTYREEQCSAYDSGETKWQPYYWQAENFCELLCQNNRKEVERKSTHVKDGTQCMRGIRDICIGGRCKTIPCDNDLMSHAVEDACGVCHGDGTSCNVERGSKTFPKHVGVLKHLVNIPVGATNIRVEEMSPTEAKIVVKYKNKPITHGTPSGKFLIGNTGMTGWMGMLKNQQELLYIKGPTTESLSVSVHAGEEVTVAYSLGVKAETRRQPHFHWDFAEWSECSADCGTGTQVAKAQCMEKVAGLVESSHCKYLEKPEPQLRICHLKDCEI